MSRRTGFSKLSFHSGGEVETMIHGELFYLRVVTYWPTAQGAPLPLLEEARKALPPGRSYGYINGRHSEARIWFAREEDFYSVFISYEVAPEVTDAITLLANGDAKVVSRQGGWTKIEVLENASIPLVVAALRNWAYALPCDDGERRKVEYRF